MKNGCLKKFGTSFLLAPALLLTTLPATAQYYGQDNRQYQNRDYNRQSYYNGMRDGGRGGNYDRNDREHYRDNGYDGYYRNNRNYNHGDYRRDEHDGGIGPGKGALIGGAGGAVLGALFGGSMKGAIIGGAAGAGVGAIAGKAAQDNREDRREDRYRDNY